MDLEPDSPEPVDDEPVSPQVGGDGGEADTEPAPSIEPSSRHDDGMAERLRSIESQSRFYQEEAERNRRELESLRAAQRHDPREEQARIDAMDPEQRVLYFVDKNARESQNQVAMIEARTSAQIDQLKFDAELSQTAVNLGWSNAQKAKYSAEIEAAYTNYSRQNLTIPRGALLRHRLGEELMTSGAKAIKSASDKGKANIGAQRAKMTPASSNVTGKTSGKSKAQESMERLLQAGVLEM